MSVYTNFCHYKSNFSVSMGHYPHAVSVFRSLKFKLTTVVSYPKLIMYIVHVTSTVVILNYLAIIIK